MRRLGSRIFGILCAGIAGELFLWYNANFEQKISEGMSREFANENDGLVAHDMRRVKDVSIQNRETIQSIYISGTEINIRPLQIDAPLKHMFYLHVPKCGSGLATAMVQYGCPDFPIRNVSIPEPEGQILGKYYNFEKLCGDSFVRFRSRHDPLPLYEGMKSYSRSTVVMMMRDPKERIISGFLHDVHDCRDPELNWLRVAENWPIRVAAFFPENRINLTRSFVRYWGCVQGCVSWMLLGYPCGDNYYFPHANAYHDNTHGQYLTAIESLKQKKAEILYQQTEPLGWEQRRDSAIQVLKHVSFVGILERWNDTIDLWRNLNPGNYTPSVLYKNTRPSQRDEYKHILYKIIDFHGLVDEMDDLMYKIALARFDLTYRIVLPPHDA